MFLAGLLALIFAAAAGLLLVAGAVKLRRPETTAQAMRSVGLPSSHILVRSLGAVEIAVGVAGLIAPAAAGLPLALLYVSFGAFVAAILSRGLPLASCGCLGETETRPSRTHVTLTVIAAAAGVAAALLPPPTLVAVLAADPVQGTLLLVMTATTTYLAYLTLAFLPEALSAYRRPSTAGGSFRRVRRRVRAVNGVLSALRIAPER